MVQARSEEQKLQQSTYTEEQDQWSVMMPVDDTHDRTYSLDRWPCIHFRLPHTLFSPSQTCNRSRITPSMILARIYSQQHYFSTSRCTTSRHTSRSAFIHLMVRRHDHKPKRAILKTSICYVFYLLRSTITPLTVALNQINVAE